MEKAKKNNKPSVSVVIPMRNAATTLPATLKTITSQKYPIEEIILVDNVSKDTSREIVLAFAKKSKIPIRLLVQKKDKGVASSYNWGTKEAKSDLVVFLTSDCSLPTSGELEKLTYPLRKDPSVVASFSTSVLPGFVWDTYNFWEKYHGARMVDNRSSMMVLKFDCIRKSVFLQVGGFDERNFGGDGAIGGEDADLNMRLRKAGKIVRSRAESLHLHYMASDYTLANMAKSRKMYARSIGRFLRKSPFKSPGATLIFLIRPVLAVLPFVPGFLEIGILLLLVYSLFYSQKMFTTKTTLLNPRIFAIPFLNIYFLYYELYWTLAAFFSFKKEV